jgi:hypothetical protein
MSKEEWSLEDVDLLASLSASERRIIEGECRVVDFKKDSDIVKRGDYSRDVIFVVRGRVLVFNYASSGKLIALDEVSVGGYCGELAAIDGLGRSASVSALESDTKIAFLPHDLFLKVVDDHPEVAAKLRLRLANIVRKSTEQVLDIGFVNWWRQLVPKLLERSTLIFGFLYLYVSLVGVLHSLHFYRQFGLNVFSYFDVSDFFLSGLKEPLIMMIPVTTISIAVILVLLGHMYRQLLLAVIDKWIESHHRPRDTKGLRYKAMSLLKWSYEYPLRSNFYQHLNLISLVCIIGFSFAFVLPYSKDEAGAVIERDNRSSSFLNEFFGIKMSKISVTLKDGEKSSDLTGVWNIGSTQRFLFAYDYCSQRVHVLPVSEIAKISATAPGAVADKQIKDCQKE